MQSRMKIRPPPRYSPDSEPESLLEQCTNFAILHLDILAVIDPFTNRYRLREGVTLPSEICERLFEAYQQTGNDVDDQFASIFQNPSASRLRRIRLRNSSITDEGLYLLLNHNLLELDISNCPNLTEKSFEYLNEKGESLQSLSLGTSGMILRYTPWATTKRIGPILKTPNLRKLSVQQLNFCGSSVYFTVLLKPLSKLTHLDLSNCDYLGDMSHLTNLPCLTSLILYNVKLIFSDALPSLIKLKSLKHLDISQLLPKNGTYAHPNHTLAALVENLPNLVSLDISGTNLAGTGVAEHLVELSDDCFPTDIPGLRSRVGNPFEFLGLFKTHHEACRRHDIPAKYISGDADEEQLLNAMVAYMDRPDLLSKVIDSLFNLSQFQNDNLYIAVRLVLEAMNRHLYDKQIQISGSGYLFCLHQMKGKKIKFESQLRHHIVSTIVNGMVAFSNDNTVTRNGCFILSQFIIPEDMMFDYDRLVHIILHVLNETDQETGLLQRTVICLLNSLACQAERDQKLLLGELGAVSHMLMIIKDKLERRLLDDVLQVAWSTMWNVTDETAINCRRFLDGNGMELFLRCLSMCAGRDELLRSMMGLLGNVAEVKSLRPRLMMERYVIVFTDLLDSLSDGIEVSYNAAGVLAHMCSDGPEAWTVREPKRDVVLRKMVAAIEMWDLSVERIINYRSFQPILGLLKVHHTPECQHWAVWALANLTKVYPKKYCPLVSNDGGIPMLEEVIQSETSYQRIKELAGMVINNCVQHKQKRVYYE